MSNTVNKVPMGQKIAFGIGMFANQMFPAILGIFMVVIIEDLGFPGWMFGILQFGPRILDAITDPLMGFISDNTRSKWGRRRKYVFIGAIITGLAFIIMWQLDSSNSINYNFSYFLIWSIVFYLGITIFSVPYVAMGYEMSDDFHERTNIMAIAQWIGQWAWVIAPWFWVIMYDPNWFPSGDVAAKELAIWVGIACMIMAMVPAIFIKSESSTHREDYASINIKSIRNNFKDIVRNFKEAFKIKPFRKLCIATFLIYNAFMTVAQFSFFIIIYYLFNGDRDLANEGYWPTLFGTVGALITTFLVIPIVAKISKKIGKKKAFIVSQGISIIGYVLFWFLFIPGKPYMFLFGLPFFSFGMGSLFTLMMSMTADVIDLDELNTGLRREGVFGAIYWWMVKIGFAVAGGLTGLIFTIIGFHSGEATQTPEAVTGLRIFFSGLPILGTLGAIWIMRNYSVDEVRSSEIRKKLEARKKNSQTLNSYYKQGKLLEFANPYLSSGLKTDIDSSITSETELKSLFNKALNNGLHGLCFSPYKEGQTIFDELSEAQIVERMQIIKPYTNWVRSFSCTNGNQHIAKIAKQQGLKTMVGAWIGNNIQENNNEINALINLAKQGNVDIAVIGNEVLMRNDLTEEQVINYINHVKKELPNLKVAYVDAYYQFIKRPKLVEACDVILVNCYPFWEGCEINLASAYVKEMYLATQKIAKGKPVIITETGWPDQGNSVGKAKPSAVNAMKYFINVTNWAEQEQIPLFYFSSFDESWKVHHEGDVGARWGIWDKNETLKF